MWVRDRSWIVVAVAVLLIAGGAVTQMLRSHTDVVVVDKIPIVRTSVPAMTVPPPKPVECAEGGRIGPDGKLELFTSCR